MQSRPASIARLRLFSSLCSISSSPPFLHLIIYIKKMDQLCHDLGKENIEEREK
jgi:hypothetical protein